VKTIIGIDPGQSGGIAVQSPNGYWVDKMPENTSEAAIYFRELCDEDAPPVAYLEDIPKFCGPKLPGSAVFVMAENFGAIQGILAALNIRTIMVRPQEWQKGLGVGTRTACKSKTQWKQKLKAEAQRRFPTLKLTNATADAALILDYAMTKEKQ
jgi:hypothetical protein